MAKHATSNTPNTQKVASSSVRLGRVEKKLDEAMRTLDSIDGLDAHALEYVVGHAQDSALRQAAVASIDSESALNRLLQQSRTKDKAVYRAVNAKLDRLREMEADKFEQSLGAATTKQEVTFWEKFDRSINTDL